VTATRVFTDQIAVQLILNIFDTNADQLFVGPLFVDEFEIFEYIDVVDPPSCTLEIDVSGTVVVDETSPGANDASITVATTGGIGTKEYSRNGGSWQLSNLFAGIGAGVHTISVREQATPTCNDTQAFSVNSAGISFDFTLSATNETVSGANDGVIEVTVTGTGGPFTFAKNGGSYQGSNIFPGLTPGTWFITVKNAAGNTLTKSIVISAGVVLFQKAYFSRNPVTFQQQAASGWEALSNYRLYDDIRVEDVAGTSIYNSKLKVDQPPETDGHVLFSVRKAFRDVLKAIPPSINESTIKRLTDRIKYFKHFTGELQDDEVTPSVLTGSDPSLVMLGGISTLKYPGMNYFTSYLPTTKKFMTWAPVQKMVDRQQEDYLNFWIYNTTITVLKLRIKAYYDDGTNQTQTMLTVNGTVFGQLYQVPAGTSNSGVLTINPAKTLIRYELSMLNQADAVVSELRIYHVAQVHHPLTRHFLFENSLGAHEVLRFTGAAQLKTSFVREVIQKFLPDNYSALDGQFEVNSVVATKQSGYSSGYFKEHLTKEWHQYMEDFLLTKKLFDVTAGPRIPLTLVSGDLVVEDQNYERFVRFEVQPSFDSESYSPEDL
jgi:hypothetical protein